MQIGVRRGMSGYLEVPWRTVAVGKWVACHRRSGDIDGDRRWRATHFIDRSTLNICHAGKFDKFSTFVHFGLL